MSYQEFFDAEMMPLVRRMADNPRPGVPGQAEQRREIRAMIWQGLQALRQSYGDTFADTVELAEFLGSIPYQGPLLDTLAAYELKAPPEASYALSIGGAPLAVGELLHGRRGFVRFASEVDYLVVVGDPGIALVARDHPSVSLRRQEEIGRGELFEVSFAATPAADWLDQAAWPQVLANARVRQAAYLVGLSQAALWLAVDYAKQRRQFGKPIGKFQALAFRLSELSMRVDAARLLARAASDHLTAAQCLAAAADLAREVTTAAMQVHGAVGMTQDSDMQLFYRRAAVESVWLGTPTELRMEAVPLLAARMRRD